MTVSSTVNREQYATNGVTTAFTIHFPFFSDTDVNAIWVESDGTSHTLTLNTDYTVTGGDGSGGTLTTTGSLSPLANSGTLTVYRELDFTQEDDYVEDDPLPADTLEGGFDRAVMRDQQLKDGQDRALTFPVTIGPDVSAELPNPEAGKLVGWAADGLSLENKDAALLGAVTDATEAIAGIAKIATSAKALAGADDADFMTALKTKAAIDARAADAADIAAGTSTTEFATPSSLLQILIASRLAQFTLSR